MVRWLPLMLLWGCGYKQQIATLETTLAESTEAAADVARRLDAKTQLHTMCEVQLAERIEDVAALKADRAEMLKGEEGVKNVLRQELQQLDQDLAACMESGKTTAAELAALTRSLATSEAEVALARDRAARLLNDEGVLKAEIEDMKLALEATRKLQQAAEAQAQQFRDLVDQFKEMIDAGSLNVEIVNGRMVLVLATDVLFPSGSATLSRAGKDVLLEVGAALAQMEERRFQVEGHTDNVPIKTATYPSNWHLAAARSINVVLWLTDEAGMDPARVSAASFGETVPRMANDTPEARASNRRIEIVLLTDLDMLPEVGGETPAP
ncbi:MAG: OmpA family protein [Myxococcota bacterium]